MKRYSVAFKIISCAALVFTMATMSTFFQSNTTNAQTKAETSKETQAGPKRQMEDLGRGVVAVRNGSSVFISWRLLALDSSDIGFNVYRSTSGGRATKLDSSTLTGGTNYTDNTADLTKENTYYIKPVIKGKEQDDKKDKKQGDSNSFTLTANHADEPCITVPLKSGGSISNVWVGDFDGDHEYDYLVDRDSTTPQTIEAYKRDGTLLWSASLGPNSSNKNNISPGSATINVGMWDGVTVYDLDGDGKAEVILKLANGVTLGDGTVWTSDDDNKQWLGVLDGMTGKLEASCPIPDDYLTVGPMGCQLAIGSLNGKTPSVVAFMKNRNTDKSFNAMVCAFSYKNRKLKMDWKWLRGDGDFSDGHTLRIADLDEDGKDEICDIGFVLNGDGTVRYNLNDQNVYHGDRFYVGKLVKDSVGLQGYGIQQDNPAGLLEYFYNAATGSMIWQHTAPLPAGDVGRGVIGDIDPRYPGYEVWSFSGIYNAATNTQITPADKVGFSSPDNRPYPALRLWWDGDTLSESVNDGKIEKWDYNLSSDLNNWDYSIKSVKNLVQTSQYHTATHRSAHSPMFYGDILGDWREEVLYTNSDYSELVIFTTDIPTDTRIYTLAQNPLYRNCMASKGYPESHLTDYYLGDSMDTPPTPRIYLAK